MKTKKSYQITVAGRVQNVGFRYHTHEKANELNITGFVMNKGNGNVYIEAEGYDDALSIFINWCHKGPNWANVIDVKVTEQPVCNYSDFQIKR